MLAPSETAPTPGPPPLPRGIGTVAAALLTLVAALFWLRDPLAAFDTALWGPDQPWVHRDFLGAWWLFHAAADPALDLSLQNHPAGALSTAHHIPNPWDAWALGPLLVGHSFPGWWNRMQLAHHLANLGGVIALGRAAGLRGLSLAVAGLLVGASPLMLHEVAGGRTLSGAVWPGLLALACLLRGRSVAAGLLIGIQALLYVYNGLVVFVIALLLAPSWGLLAVAVPLVPYLWWLLPVFSGTGSAAPPADYSVLPLSGLMGLHTVPARQRLLPVLLPAAVLSLWVHRSPHRWRWAAAIAVAGLVALGPTPGAKSDTALVASPLAWMVRCIPGLGRMHHPVRAGLVLVPLLAVVAARGLQALPKQWRTVAHSTVLVSILALSRSVPEAVPHGTPRPLPGIAQAQWLRQNAGPIVDLTGSGAAALGLQPLHGRPMLEGLRRPQPKPGDHDPGTLRRDANRWLAGQRQPTLGARLHAAGFTHVLAIPRTGQPSEVPTDILTADLGPPVYPGVWALK